MTATPIATRVIAAAAAAAAVKAILTAKMKQKRKGKCKLYKKSMTPAAAAAAAAAAIVTQTAMKMFRKSLLCQPKLDPRHLLVVVAAAVTVIPKVKTSCGTKCKVSIGYRPPFHYILEGTLDRWHEIMLSKMESKTVCMSTHFNHTVLTKKIASDSLDSFSVARRDGSYILRSGRINSYVQNPARALAKVSK